MKQGKGMNRVARGALIVATCALLMGFPKVSKVHGSVTARTGNFLAGLFARPKPLAVGDSPTPFFMVKVAAGASVTLRENDCELTFDRSFLMPRSLRVCDRKQDRDDQDSKQDRQDQPQEDQQQEPRQDQGSPEQQQPASSQPGSPSTAQAPAPGTTASTGASSTAGASTAAAASTGGLTTLQATLVAIGSAAAAQRAYVEIRDKGDEPVSR
jgi:hypothetical protein